MLVSLLGTVGECCYKCKFCRFESIKVRVVPQEYRNKHDYILFSKEKKQELYPDVPDEKLIKDSIISECRCHKLPPRSGSFPIIEPDNWCGSYKERE